MPGRRLNLKHYCFYWVRKLIFLAVLMYRIPLSIRYGHITSVYGALSSGAFERIIPTHFLGFKIRSQNNMYLFHFRTFIRPNARCFDVISLTKNFGRKSDFSNSLRDLSLSLSLYKSRFRSIDNPGSCLFFLFARFPKL